MSTLRSLAQQIIRLENGGPVSDQSVWDEGHVMALVRQGANLMLNPIILGQMSDDDRSAPPLLIVRYTVDVLEDGDSAHSYIELPEFYKHLSFNRGLKGISLVEEPDQEMIPRQQPGVSRGLACADAEQQLTYFQEGTRILFDKPIDVAKVLLKLLVAAPSSIGPDAALPIYKEMEGVIITWVRQQLANRPIQDRILDGNPDAGVRIPA